jgi:hypothetical protein
MIPIANGRRMFEDYETVALKALRLSEISSPIAAIFNLSRPEVAWLSPLGRLGQIDQGHRRRVEVRR